MRVVMPALCLGSAMRILICCQGAARRLITGYTVAVPVVISEDTRRLYLLCLCGFQEQKYPAFFHMQKTWIASFTPS